MDKINENVVKFRNIFEDIPEKRQLGKIRHKLIDVVFIAVVATIAGCDDWEEIEMFAEEKIEWFKNFLELPNGVPSHDTIERVFAWIDPVSFENRVQEWVKIIIGDKFSHLKGVVAVDGKTLRRTKDVVSGLKPLHVVNAYSNELGIVLGQIDTLDHGSEIKAIPQLLEMIDVENQIVTIDAMGTQHEIAKKIKDKKGDYVLALKGNQGNLHEEVVTFFDSELSKLGIIEYDIKHTREHEKGHGRIEKRDYYVTDSIDWLGKSDNWASIQSIGTVICKTEKNGVITTASRYFISSLPANAEIFAYAVRNHWSIESMHWSLDMTFNEDSRRSRKNNSAKNLSKLIRFAYNVLKLCPPKKKRSMKKQRMRASWNEEYLELLLSSAFAE